MAKKRKRGRPSTGGRDKARSIRVPDAEWAKWRRYARGLGKSVAGLIRDAMGAKMRGAK